MSAYLGGRTAASVAPVAFVACRFGVGVLDVQDVAEAYAGRFGIELGFGPGGPDSLRAGFGAQFLLGADVEVDAVDLVDPGVVDVERRLLEGVEVGDPDGEGGLELVA